MVYFYLQCYCVLAKERLRMTPCLAQTYLFAINLTILQQQTVEVQRATSGGHF